MKFSSIHLCLAEASRSGVKGVSTLTQSVNGAGLLQGLLPASTLWRLSANALLYVNKTGMTKGYTLWKIKGGVLYVASCDDFIGISDFGSIGSGGDSVLSHETVAMISAENLKALELDLRDQDVVIDLAEDVSFEPVSDSVSEVYSMVQERVYAEEVPDYGSGKSVTFAVHPDRLRKLSLLHPRKGYPLDCRIKAFKAEPLLCFRYGPTVRGVIMPLNRKVLEEKFTEGEVWR